MQYIEPNSTKISSTCPTLHATLTLCFWQFTSWYGVLHFGEEYVQYLFYYYYYLFFFLLNVMWIILHSQFRFASVCTEHFDAFSTASRNGSIFIIWQRWLTSIQLYKAPFIATQLNSIRRRVELSCVHYKRGLSFSGFPDVRRSRYSQIDQRSVTDGRVRMAKISLLENNRR